MLSVIVHCRITKVFKITKNLEHNNYAHVTNALRIVTLASHAFLLQDVVEPPPALLSVSIDMYASQVPTCSPAPLYKCMPHVELIQRSALPVAFLRQNTLDSQHDCIGVECERRCHRGVPQVWGLPGDAMAACCPKCECFTV